jgi:glycosyltransferase involved in cell wall biosynthesis
MMPEQLSFRSKTKILFLGYAIPKDIFNKVTAEDPLPQIQGTKLIWKIIKGIEESSGEQLDLVSVVPVSEYPRHPKIFFGYHKWKHRPPVGKDYVIPFINIVIVKHITRLLSSLVFVSRWLIKNRKGFDRKILVYAMHSPFIISALIATFLIGGKIVLIIPDLPAFMDLGIHRNIVIRIAKKIDAFLMNMLLHKMAGIVTLTWHMAKDISNGSIPTMVMEGAVDETRWQEDKSCNQYLQCPLEEKIIMYTGGLAGLEMLLSAFSLIHDPAFRLWICGRGEMEHEIVNAAAKDSRIIYWGLLSDDDFQKKCAQATIFVNPRSSKTPYIQYSFPSKLLEYMMTGRPVVSTSMPGIPIEYHKYIFLLHDESPSGFAALLQEVCHKTSRELAAIGRRAREFVVSEKNYLRQGERILKFVQSC